MQKRYQFLVSILASACITSAYAAQAVDLSHQSASILKPLLSNLKLLSQDVDRNQTVHTRYQQTYDGYPVWGGDLIVHKPQGMASKISMDGVIYQNLNQDLTLPPALDRENVIKHAVSSYQTKTGFKNPTEHEKAELMVYVDDENKAHWAYLVSFETKPANAMIEKPTFIMDAFSFNIYLQWDNIQTLDDVAGGGFGGNPKMGKLVYDGLSNHLPKLSMQRDAASKLCYLKNADVTVKDVSKSDAVSQFNCSSVDNQHDNIYWSAELSSANEAYSPDNDALYVGKVIKEMYQNWYGIPVLTENGKPMMLNMRVHENIENAYWNSGQMTFGDGGSMLYPLVSLGVGAHEVSHGFTEQHSKLFYMLQSGGINESFSDMAAQAAEYYSAGTNTWQIGPEIFKGNGALRYMDDPTKDCKGKKPGVGCSIGHVKDYTFGLNVHYSSGIYNKVFYLIATAKGWDTRKAFDIMVQANQHYWTSTTNFKNASCGVVKATRDAHYSLDAVRSAFNEVGIDTSQC